MTGEVRLPVVSRRRRFWLAAMAAAITVPASTLPISGARAQADQALPLNRQLQRRKQNRRLRPKRRKRRLEVRRRQQPIRRQHQSSSSGSNKRPRPTLSQTGAKLGFILCPAYSMGTSGALISLALAIAQGHRRPPLGNEQCCPDFKLGPPFEGAKSGQKWIKFQKQKFVMP